MANATVDSSDGGPASTHSKKHPKHASVDIEHLPMQWNPTPVTPLLPLGVALFALAIAAVGLILFLAGALALINVYDPSTVPSALLILPSVDPIGAAILLLIGTVMLGLAHALWHQERWALYLTVGALFFGEAYLFFTATITVLFLLLLVVFVYLLAVRHNFY
jgi:hypothetical protein